MKPGDIRRFNDNLDTIAVTHLEGCTFMILDVVERRQVFPDVSVVPGAMDVNVLVGGKVEGPWGYPWVKENSEALNEAG